LQKASLEGGRRRSLVPIQRWHLSARAGVLTLWKSSPLPGHRNAIAYRATPSVSTPPPVWIRPEVPPHGANRVGLRRNQNRPSAWTGASSRAADGAASWRPCAL